jgi:hypothetical protein
MNEANPAPLPDVAPEVASEVAMADGAPATRIECDICGEPIDVDDDAFVGKGVFLSVRGDEVRYENAPLCSACATAIGINALIRAEIEEDEG